jgi:chorismate synthase
LSFLRTGRVAAGAIAEKYLKQVFGIEIVAFVTSVGKIHLPSNTAPPSLTAADEDEDDDDVVDALTPEFRQLLATITREEVDKHPTRCPHPETAERMTKVRIISPMIPVVISDQLFIINSASSAPKSLWTLLAGQ